MNGPGIVSLLCTYLLGGIVTSGYCYKDSNQDMKNIHKLGVSGHQRILGGQDATPGEFPWVAIIWMDKHYFCSGSLVSPFYVLTAAHCLRPHTNFRIVMGAHILSGQKEPTRQIRDTMDKIIHEEYNSKTLQNDIALLHVALPFSLTPRVKTIRLPPFYRGDNTFDLGIATLTGWGRQADHAKFAKNLQKVDLRIMSNEDCSRIYPPGAIVDVLLCTETTKEKSPCGGDSGGALTVVEDDGLRTQIAVDTFTMGNCAAAYPQVYSRVSAFIPWIMNYTGSLMVNPL